MLAILGIPGSLRRNSYNRAALRAAQEPVPEGVQIEIFELHEIPPFNQDEEGQVLAQVSLLKARIRAADSILFVTPRIQLLNTRPAEGRHRLGLTALRGQRLGG